MKRLLFIFVSLCFVACNSDIKEEIDKPLVEDDHSLTENEAITILENFANSVSKTRSLSSFRIVDCTRKYASDFGSNPDIITRANAENIDVNAVPVYEIKTDSDEGYGFGLVLGDKRFDEVIAFCPEGSLSDTLFNEGLADFTKSIPFLIYENLLFEQQQKEQTTRSDYWQPEPTYFNYITEWDNPIIITFNSYDEACDAFYGTGHYLPWDTYDTPARYVPVKWHQEGPYNNRVNHKCDGIRGKVGCGAVALAQLMSFHKHPANYNWSLITSSQKIYPNQTAAVNEVSRLMIDLATATSTTYSCKNDGLGGSSGTTYTNSYAPALERFGYTANYVFAKSEKVSSEIVRDGIVNYGPVLFSASKSSLNGVAMSGHVWVIDGFYKKSRYYQTFTYGWNDDLIKFGYISRYRQHFVMLHNCWGWGGSSDGWYYNFTPVNEKYVFSEYHLWTVKPK